MPDARYEPEPVDFHVGKMIRHYRTMAGMSQEGLAKAMGIGRQQIRKYEAAEARITANKLFHAARVLGVPVAHFFEMPDATAAPQIDHQMLEAVAAILRSEDGCELVMSFTKIARPAVRKRVAALTRALSNAPT